VSTGLRGLLRQQSLVADCQPRAPRSDL